MLFRWKRKTAPETSPKVIAKDPLQETIAKDPVEIARISKAVTINRINAMLPVRELASFLSIREQIVALHSKGKIRFSQYLEPQSSHLIELLALAIAYYCPNAKIREFRATVTETEKTGNGVLGECAHSGKFEYEVVIRKSSLGSELSNLLLIDEFCHLAQFYWRDSRGLEITTALHHSLLGGLEEAMHTVLSGLDLWFNNSDEPLPNILEMEGKGLDISHRFGIVLGTAILRKIEDWCSNGLIAPEERPKYARAYLQLLVPIIALDGMMDINLQRISEFSNLAHLSIRELTEDNAPLSLQRLITYYTRLGIPRIFRTRAFETLPIKLRLFQLGEWSVQAVRARRYEAYPILLSLGPYLNELNDMLLVPAQNGEWGKYHTELARIFAIESPDELLSEAAKSLPQ